jgi:hypothetical protein
MHNHGYIYRAKIVGFDGQPEYSEWFNTEKALRDSMRGITRNIGKRYYCEAKMVPCTQAGCDVDQTPKVIASL